ncbi:DUF2730 family protein [Serratia fonticola]|uniref:DUF2730 family protein n=1 Tax=Serratia TaxID=613 RepID=UPI0013777068|nr:MULTISPECIES: DUF2730 family protein [Serratia]MBP1034347.1 DUF2730 family protein [Serratia fonticola]NBJ36607.1 DUF2730 family protein [Serratia fonticola]NCG50558.1 DUF2730 family protein [Serratia fonticola]
MDWEVIKGNWAIIWALFMSGISIVQLLLSKTYVKREEMDSVRERLSIVETAIEGMPRQKELHELQLEIRDLRGDLKELGSKLQPVQRISDLLLENELKDK